MPTDITFAERFQLWRSTRDEMQSFYAINEGGLNGEPALQERYDELVSSSFDCALDVLQAPAGSGADVELKRQVWEAEEAHLWGPDEIRACMSQVMADAVEMSK